MTRKHTYFVPTGGNWSGGGGVVLSNFRSASVRHSRISFTSGDITIINRNFPRTRASQPFILIPQNAWAWQGPRFGLNEHARVLGLRVASEVAMRRALGVVRVGRSLPRRGRSHSQFLPNPLDEKFEHALAQGEATPPIDGHYFVSIGSLYGYRGIESLLTAYRAFRDRGGRTPLHIVGSGTPAYVEKTRRLGKDIGGVVLHDEAVTRPECLRWLRHARAAVLPSHVEASPISLLEALAVQPTVIASDIPGHRDIVPADTPEPGWFRHDEPQTLVTALLSSAEHPTDQLTHPLADPAFRLLERQRWADQLMQILDDLAEA